MTRTEEREQAFVLIFEKEFNLEDKKTIAELKFNNKTEYFDVVFDFIEDYVFVCAFQAIKN